MTKRSVSPARKRSAVSPQTENDIDVIGRTIARKLKRDLAADRGAGSDMRYLIGELKREVRHASGRDMAMAILSARG